MANEVVELVDVDEPELPDDYEAFTKVRNAGPVVKEEALAAGEEKKPTSESTEEVDQTASESETEEEAEATGKDDPEDEEEKVDPKKPAHGQPDKGMSRRVRKLTGEIKTLKSQLAELQSETEDGEEAPEEVVSSPEKPAADEPTKLVRPMLKDYEDNETTGESAWDQYEKALDEFNEARTEQKLTKALADQREKLDFEHAKATADADWAKASSRFENFNEVVGKSDVKINAAMEAVMRMNPEKGTAIAYWLGQHPEESLRIANATLANNEKQWTTALAMAGTELGEITAKLKAEAAKPELVKPKTPVAPPPTVIKKVTTASKPPTQIRGGTAPPATDVLDDDDAANYEKWRKAREAQLARR